MYCCCYSVTKLCPTLCNPVECSAPGFPVLHYLREFAQTHVKCVDDATQPSHPLLISASPRAFNHSQHQGLFQWVNSLHQVAKVLVIQHQSFQWIFRVGFLWDWLLWSPWQYKGLWRVFSSTTWRQQFFGAQPLRFSSHIRTWVLENRSFD